MRKRRRFLDFPGLIRNDDFFAAILVDNLYLAKHSRSAVSCRPASGMAIVPSVAHEHAQGIFAPFKEMCNVIGKIHHAIAAEIIISQVSLTGIISQGAAAPANERPKQQHNTTNILFIEKFYSFTQRSGVA